LEAVPLSLEHADEPAPTGRVDPDRPPA